MALDVATMTSLAGATGLGSFLGQWLAGGKDRRTVRAAALNALSEAEHARWAGPGRPDNTAFSQAMRDLGTAALIARVPRLAVQEYVVLATAARLDSSQNADKNPGSDTTGRVDMRLNQLVREAAGLVADTIWFPARRHFQLGRRLKALANGVDSLTYGVDLIRRAREMVG